ncbi:biotin transporter BioY [Halobacillus mangrovi]|uniref:Biotin transporter n=1 Tax=Halobacillus mangrovi TaxID=402384 RepID=A0A1W5ZVT7_9BACI|nr:biotin transporter BioY [Halobacillus mangrovi]ARI77361.1 biotin transporter BioY [Halobacillus mangrovi]
MSLKTMVYASLFAAIVGALGLLPPIALPFNPVPITAQTLGVMLAGALLGARRGALSILVFILLVAIGVPLLSGGRGGIGVFFGPSGGYILSWPIAAFVIGLIVETFYHRLHISWLILANVVGGIVVVYACGITYLSLITNTPWTKAAFSALAFIPGDFVKVVAAAFIAKQVHRAYPLIEKERTEKPKQAA